MSAAGFPRSPLVVGAPTSRGHFSCGCGGTSAGVALRQDGGPYALGEHKGTGSLEIQVGSGGVGY